MKNLNVGCVTAMLLGVAITGVAGAQEQQFPAERSQAKSCDAVKWNAEMVRAHPGLIDACREVINVDGATWARFSAKFVRVEPDGQVTFSVHDQTDRSLEQVRLTPAAGQVAYLDDRPVPFRQLRATDSISLYVPEGEYGFATQPGAPREKLALVAPAATPATPATPASPALPASSTPVKPAPAPVADAPMMARQETLPAALPRTAGPMPWVALGGLLSLLGGLGLTLRRRR